MTATGICALNTKTPTKSMTRLTHTSNKLGRRTTRAPKEWESRTVEEIQEDLKVVSEAWGGTREDKRAWGQLKRELKVARLEAARIAAKAARAK